MQMYSFSIFLCVDTEIKASIKKNNEPNLGCKGNVK